jgi:hypothetical protein
MEVRLACVIPLLLVDGGVGINSDIYGLGDKPKFIESLSSYRLMDRNNSHGN